VRHHLTPPLVPAPVQAALIYGFLLAVALLSTTLVCRIHARRKRRYVRFRVVPYRGDDPTVDGIVGMYEALHKRLLRRWWRRLFNGQPSVALEIHLDRFAWLSLTCPVGLSPLVEAALRTAYPNVVIEEGTPTLGSPPCVLRLKKHFVFTRRSKRVDRFEHDRSPAVNRLITTMALCGEPAFVQIALTPAPSFFEAHAKRAYKHHENRLSRERHLQFPPLDRSRVEEAELHGGLDVQHRPLFFCDVRIVAASRGACERIASELRASCAENPLVERGTALRHGRLGLYTKRVLRGEGNLLPPFRKGVFASTELAGLWHLPSLDYSAVPLQRHALPLAPAPPGILRASGGGGVLCDAFGLVSIHPSLRCHNTCVSGGAGQGKSSYLVASVAEDLRREECAVIVLDPKGDIAEAAVSVVPPERTCTLLDLAHPACGFHPRAVETAAVEMARPLGSPLLTGALLKGPLKVSFDDILTNGEVLVVKGALGTMGVGYTSVLMQLLVGMLESALARRHDRIVGGRCTPVALKVDEAMLVLSRKFLDSLALNRSAGLETVACWQSDAQWTERDVRRQLDSLFAHRVYFATSSIEEARSAAKLTMAEFSDVVRPDVRNLSPLGRPDVRLHLPLHSAVASWVTPLGRQAPFIAHTLPLRVDAQRLSHHAARQAERADRSRDDSY
jgi:hypothetical protein